MTTGTTLVMIVGAIGLIAVLLIRTSGSRTALRNRAALLDQQLRPPTPVDDAIRNDALLLLDRGEKIMAIKLVHERTDMGLREARDFVEHLNANTTFVDDDDDPPAPRELGGWNDEDRDQR